MDPPWRLCNATGSSQDSPHFECYTLASKTNTETCIETYQNINRGKL